MSLEASRICVVDASGKIVKEAKLSSKPETLITKIGPALSSSNTIRRRPSADPVQKHAPGSDERAKKGLTTKGPL